MARATALRDAVKRRFHPFAESRGFTRMRASNYFTPFRRVRGGQLDVFDVQWDKYWRPRFILNFGRGDAKSPDDEARFERVGRLQRRQGGGYGCWFQLRRPWPKVLTTARWSYTPDEVVDELIAAFAELEGWWSDNIEGPHVYVRKLSAPE